MPVNRGGKPPGGIGNPVMGIMPFRAKFCRLKPLGVPVAAWPLAGGKWPFELASVLLGAMCAGSMI
jgi:hypothetical protein